MAKTIDSLDDYTKEELLAYAEQFGVEARHSMTKAAILKAFEEDGVDFQLVSGYNKSVEEYDAKDLGLHPTTEGELEQTAPVVEVEEDDEDLVLVKMTRLNGTYEIRGYHFTKEHPFALVKEDDADYLIERDGGFRMASPKEARAYYS